MAQAHSFSSRRVFLIGFMGAGKTSVGRALASRLGWRFCDLDNMIELRERATVAAIFAQHGEPGFRALETRALKELLQDASSRHDLVVALGGGAFLQPENREELKRARATTVLLQAPVQELRRRCAGDETVRPLARDEARFIELFEARASAYALARYKVNTMGKAVEDVAAEIESILTATTPEVEQ